MPLFALMNKNTRVLDFEYDVDAHACTRIFAIHNRAAAPFGLFNERGETSKREFNHWWWTRAIPASREQIQHVLDNLRLASTIELAERNFGLSLSDCYWIDDLDAPQRWEDVNFFDNDFSDDLGLLTLGQDSDPASTPDYAKVNLTSPNSTLGGDLRKKWKIIDGTRTLVKAGTGFINQEPYNEVAATALHRRLLQEGDFVAYWLLREERRTYCACANMLGPDEELVAAWDLIRNRKKDNRESELQFYVRCCEELGIRGVMEGLAKMFVCDFVIANRDRHWRNFGIIRNVETLGDCRLAPIFDTGGCLWSDVETLERPRDFEYIAKPFKYNGMKPKEQLKLFAGHMKSWFDVKALDGYADEVAEILSRNPNIAPARIERIAGQVRQNIQLLSSMRLT